MYLGGRYSSLPLPVGGGGGKKAQQHGGKGAGTVELLVVRPFIVVFLHPEAVSYGTL